MTRLRRSAVAVILAIVIVPAVAYGTRALLGWFDPGLRLEGDPAKANYLIGAAQHAHWPEVERVVGRGITPATAADDEGYTALMGAALGGDERIVRLLLDRGAMVNAQTLPNAVRAPAGLSALMVAASVGRLEAARLLLERGADPDLRATVLRPDGGPVRGVTALSLAAEGGHLPVVDLLLAHGARSDIYRTDHDGKAWSPLMLALSGDRVPVAERLAAAGASVDRILAEGPWRGCTELMIVAQYRPEPAPETARWAARSSRGLGRYGEGDCDGKSAYLAALAAGNYATALEFLRAGGLPYPRGVPATERTRADIDAAAASLERRLSAGR